MTQDNTTTQEAEHAIYSMTGYANIQHNLACESGKVFSLNLEIRGVNSRFLDFNFRFAEDFRSHEPYFREYLNKHLTRGKIELRFNVQRAKKELFAEPSTESLQQIKTLQNKVQQYLSSARDLSVVEILDLMATQVSAETVSNEQIAQMLHLACNDFKATRAREGERLKKVLLDSVDGIQALVEQARPLVPQAVRSQRQRFITRWQEAIQTSQASQIIPEETMYEKALSEAVAYAMRIDVAEEMHRLESHITELKLLLAKGGVIGKRLDFMVQELHREANTLGSKSTSLELSKISVEMKVLIEQIREQVQNIE